jgi:hypothetical protein
VSGLSWWRIELDGAGALVSAQRLDGAPQHDGGGVYIVEATSEASAILLAQRTHQRDALRQRRAQRDAQGVCRCGRPRDSEFLRCSLCRVRSSRDQKRSAARKRGEPVETPSKVEAHQERRATVAESTRLHALYEVQRAWQLARRNSDFTEWLRAEIERAGGQWRRP